MKVFLVIKAIISMVFGLGFIIIPAVTSSLYGIQLDSYGLMMARWFAAFLVGIGLICIFTSMAADSKLQQGVFLSLFIADIIGFINSLVSQLAGLMNALGWILVAIWLILALGVGYLRFLWKGSPKDS